MGQVEQIFNGYEENNFKAAMGVPTHKLSLSNRKLWSVKHIPKTRINNDGTHPNINTHQNDISHSEKDCFALKQPGDGSPMLGGQIQLRFFF